MLAIEVKGLYFYYVKGEYVLEDINFEIEEGESVVIMGSNGAGKTTLIKHFNGLLKPIKGHVKVLGKDTKECTVAELSKLVGIVFQNPGHQLFAETVEKEVRFALENFGFSENEIRRRVSEILKYFALEKYKNLSPFNLSEGEKKRLAIASVLVYEPDIVVLDEPTIGQDAIQRKKIAEVLRGLIRDGKTVIAVTHDVEFAVELFQRAIILSRGRLIADGDVKDVLTDQEILKAANLLPSQITECAWLLRDLGFPNCIVSIQELEEHIIKALRG